MAQTHRPVCGYATAEARLEYYEAKGISPPNKTSKQESLQEGDLTADLDRSKPLYYWQLYSLLGEANIYTLVRNFYARVFDDDADPDFKQAFVRVAGIEHHVETQASYWLDALGGGRQYHGSGYRLKFHHQNNAASVMNAEGATRWMYHMGLTLKELEPIFAAIDPRIPAVIVEFLTTKMKKYAKQFQWRFNTKDFDVANTLDPDVALANIDSAPGDGGSSTVYGQRQLDGMSIQQLKKICRNLGVSTRGCSEKKDLLAVIGTRATIVQPILYTEKKLMGMTIAHLKQVAKCLSVRMHGCIEKKDMVLRLVESGKITMGEKDEVDAGGKRK